MSPHSCKEYAVVQSGGRSQDKKKRKQRIRLIRWPKLIVLRQNKMKKLGNQQTNLKTIYYDGILSLNRINKRNLRDPAIMILNMVHLARVHGRMMTFRIQNLCLARDQVAIASIIKRIWISCLLIQLHLHLNYVGNHKIMNHLKFKIIKSMWRMAKRMSLVFKLLSPPTRKQVWKTDLLKLKRMLKTNEFILYSYYILNQLLYLYNQKNQHYN